MKTVFLATLCALAVAGAALAAQPQDWGDFKADWLDSAGYESSQALCRSVRGREPPAADRPTPDQAAALRGCSSEALYYGIGMPADPERARLCAFVEESQQEENVSPYPFTGRAMLMTIYANGLGARRDLDVAIHLACGIEGAPAESHGRVTRLAALRDQRWTGSDFHYCDDVTSGLAGGYCADHGATIAGARREAEFARLAARWPVEHRRSFAELRAAHGSYVEARGESEVDLSGTLRAAMQIGAEESLRDELLDMLRKLEARQAPAFTSAQFRLADASLNAAYRRILRADQGDGPGAVTPEGIRRTQRAWLRYRDSFLAFAALRYPEVPRASLAAWLTRQRTELLANPIEY